MTRPMLRIRRKEARKIAKLARAFAALDDAGTPRPPRAQARRAAVARSAPRRRTASRRCRGTTPSPSATTRSRTRRAPRRSCCSGATSASARTSRVLDLACGKGGPALLLASTFGCSVYGIERAPEFVEAAHRRIAAAGARRISSRSSRPTRTPFRSSPRAWDAALCLGATLRLGRPRRDARGADRRRCGPAATSSSASRTGGSGRCRAASTTRAASRCARPSAASRPRASRSRA